MMMCNIIPVYDNRPGKLVGNGIGRYNCIIVKALHQWMNSVILGLQAGRMKVP